MRFFKTEVSNFNQCYLVERPYTSYPDSVQENASDFYQIPSTLINLAQIVQYYQNAEFNKAGRLCHTNNGAAQVNVHNFSRSMVPQDSSKWDSEIDKLMKSIETLGQPLIAAQLAPKAEL